MDKTEDVARYIIQNAAQKDKDRKYERETDRHSKGQVLRSNRNLPGVPQKTKRKKKDIREEIKNVLEILIAQLQFMHQIVYFKIMHG